MPGLKRVLSAGAPVRVDVLENLTKMLGADAQIFTPFGATESLPVASIGSKEVLADTGRLAIASPFARRILAYVEADRARVERL